MKKFIFLSLTISFSMTAIASQKTSEVSASQIDLIRIHTTKHAASAARKIVILKILGLEEECSLGVFFDSEENSATLSLALSAFVSKSNMNIGYETDSRAPWGDRRYCELTYIDIK